MHSPETALFVSLYAHDRAPQFAARETKQLILSKMAETKKQFRLNVAGYVLLDDHLHWLFLSPAGNENTAVINHFRSAVQRDWRIRQRSEAQLWAAGGVTRPLTGRDDLRHHLDFIHYDPVRHEVVARAADYPWSSFPARVAEGHYADDWGTMGPPAGVEKVRQHALLAA